MITIGQPVETRTRPSGFAAVSLLLHVCILGMLLHHRALWTAPVRLAGTQNGTQLVLDYRPGKAPTPTAVPQAKVRPRQTIATAPKLPPLRRQPAPPSPNATVPASEHPDSSIGTDSFGSGDVKIALATFFPSPKPDLSILPRGTRGDVVLDIVIDTAGKVADIKMAKGLGHGVDDTVIATVQQWTFHPATKDGQPVASEQELYFHYET